MDEQRNPDGTFRKGTSGNPDGRPRKHPQRHRFPVDNARTTIAVAETPVRMMVNGREEETSLYNAVMMSLGRDAVNGDKAARRLFLDELRAATASLEGHSALVHALVEKGDEEERQLQQILALFSEPGRGGTFHRQRDGTILPARWSDSLQRLSALDEKEAEIRKRQIELEAREHDLLMREVRSGLERN